MPGNVPRATVQIARVFLLAVFGPRPVGEP